MLEMGEPVRILYLAEQMIRLSGLTPYKDVPIVFTGLRPGEKLDEELTSNVEAAIPTVVEKIRLVNTDEVDADTFAFGLERIDALLAAGTEEEVRDAVRSLVPEYAEFAARPPFADVEIPLVATGNGIAGWRTPARADAPPTVPPAVNPLDPAVAPAVNVVARAS
jgi:hypothetical protein